MLLLETFQSIRSLLNPEKTQTCANATLNIQEIGKQATMRQVSIVSVGASAFALKYDACGFPGQNLFAVHPSMHRACDSIAFCEVDNEPFILCCELKSSEPSRHEVAQQFRSAHCFLAYLDTLLQQYCDGQSIANWQRRYFVFHNQGTTPVSKRPSMEDRDNTSPETALFIPTHTGAKQYVRQLLGKPL
jgi:hypothetical protein